MLSSLASVMKGRGEMRFSWSVEVGVDSGSEELESESEMELEWKVGSSSDSESENGRSFSASGMMERLDHHASSKGVIFCLSYAPPECRGRVRG